MKCLSLSWLFFANSSSIFSPSPSKGMRLPPSRKAFTSIFYPSPSEGRRLPPVGEGAYEFLIRTYSKRCRLPLWGWCLQVFELELLSFSLWEKTAFPMGKAFTSFWVGLTLLLPLREGGFPFGEGVSEFLCCTCSPSPSERRWFPLWGRRLQVLSCFCWGEFIECSCIILLKMTFWFKLQLDNIRK